MARVWNVAKQIQELEGRGDLLTIELAALLHDISDPKFNNGDEELGSKLAFNFLMENDVDRALAGHVQKIIKYSSFKGGLQKDNIHTIEFQIVQDADRLDAMGAIGIARAFHYGGFKNRPIYDPDISPREYKDARDYRNSDSPTINHFYEKLLKLKDLMNTPAGRLLADERYRYMKDFLGQFLREWNL